MKFKFEVLQKDNYLDIVLPSLGALVIFLNLSPIAFNLPILGDGCIHALIMKQIAQNGLLGLKTIVSYPLFYHLVGAYIYKIFGVGGIKLISPIAFSLSGVVTYFIVLKLTKNRAVAFFSTLFIAFSPKVIWYGAQVYLEPFMTLFILLATYGAILLIERKDLKTTVIAGILFGLAIATKQQALFLLIAIPVALLLTKVRLKDILLVVGLAILIAVGPYVYMFASTEALIQPPPDSVLLRLDRNNTKNRILFGRAFEQIPEWSKRLEVESNGHELYSKGTRIHEARHARIFDMGNINTLVKINSLYAPGWYGFISLPNDATIFLLKVLFLAGLALSFGFALKDRKWFFLLSLLIISWLFMDLGSDTKRYFIYLPILLAFTYPLALAFVTKIGKSWREEYICSLLVFLFIVFLVPGMVDNVSLARTATEKLRMAQCYSVSRGGMASVEEAGEWIEKHSNTSQRIFGTSAYEWIYYSNRHSSFDYRIYFLSEERIDYWLRFWDTRYVLVRENQLIPDKKWRHLEYYPQSFVDKIVSMYPLVYTSYSDDIRIYEIE